MSERIEKVAYRLELPPTLLHLVFHVSVLKKKVGDSNLVMKDLLDFDDEKDIVLKQREVLHYRHQRGS